MKLRVPRIPILSTLAFLLLVTVVVLWVRSPRHADVLAFFTPQGNLTGLASDRRGMLFCTTQVPFGQEMGLTADGLSTSADEFASIHDLLFDPANEKWHFLGFRVAAGTLSTWGWKFNAIIVPYWALLIPLAILPLTGFRRVIVRARRKRRGQCLACGYDLRHTPDRCPECGRPVGGAGTMAAAEPVAGRTAITVAGLLPWLLLGALIAAAVNAVVRGRRVAAVAATAPPERAVLERGVGQIDVHGVTMERAAASLGRVAGARVQVDGIDPRSPAAQTPGRLALRGVSLGAALRSVCDAPGSGSGEALQPWASGPVVHVGPASGAPQVVRVYPVGKLLRDIQADLDREAAEAANDPVQQRGVTNALFSGSQTGAADSAEELGSLIVHTVRVDDWWDNGGRLGGLQVIGGRLWVCQTQEGHAAVRTILAALRATEATSAPDEAEANPHANLEQRIPELNLESATLESAIESIRQSTRANIIVYWNDLAAAGVHRDAPVKLHLWDVTLDGALGAVLAVSGGSPPGMRAVQDGMIVIAAPERLRDGSNAVHVYDVRDLVESYREESHPSLQSVQSRGPQTAQRADAAGDVPTFQETMDNITRLIEDLVDTDSWKDNGGSIGTIRELGGRLVIGQTPAAHRQIAALLDTLRAGGSKEGTDLSRFAR